MKKLSRPSSAKPRSISNQVADNYYLEQNILKPNSRPKKQSTSRPTSGRPTSGRPSSGRPPMKKQNFMNSSYKGNSSTNNSSHSNLYGQANDENKLPQVSNYQLQQDNNKQDLYIERLSLKKQINQIQKSNQMQKTKIQQLEGKIQNLKKQHAQLEKQSAAASAVQGYWKEQKPSEIVQGVDKIAEQKEKIQFRREELSFFESQLKELNKQIRFCDQQELELAVKYKHQQTKDIKSQIDKELLRKEIIDLILSGQIEQIDDIFRNQTQGLEIDQQELKLKNENCQEENLFWKEKLRERNQDFCNLKKISRDMTNEMRSLEKEQDKLIDELDDIKKQQQQIKSRKQVKGVLNNKDLEIDSYRNQIMKLEEDIEEKNKEMKQREDDIQNNELKYKQKFLEQKEIGDTLEKELQSILTLNRDLENQQYENPQTRSIVLQNKQIFAEVKKEKEKLRKQSMSQQERRSSIQNILQNSFRKVQQQICSPKAETTIHFHVENKPRSKSKESNVPNSKNDQKQGNLDSGFSSQTPQQLSEDQRKTQSLDEMKSKLQQEESERKQLQQQETEKLKITEMDEKLEESPLKKLNKLKNTQQQQQQQQQNQQSPQHQSLNSNSEGFRLQKLEQDNKDLELLSALEKFKVQSHLQDIQDEQLDEILKKLYWLPSMGKLLREGEKQMLDLFELQDVKMYAYDLKQKQIFKFNAANKRQDFKLDIGICGDVIQKGNIQFVNSTYNNSFFNPMVDIDTQLPIICIPLQGIDQFSNDIVTGVVEFINPKGLQQLIKFRQVSVQEELPQQLINFCRILGQLIIYFQERKQ